MALKVLVVDNNPVLLRAISAILEKENCEVKAAENGLVALELLKNYKPDIVFTDLVMPLVDGEQLCKIIRNSREYKDIFLVVISGIILEDIENILADKYYDLCIAKGNLKELRSHVKDALQFFAKKQDPDEGKKQTTETKIPNGLVASTIAGELLSEKRHLHRILQNLEEGIVELNKDGVVVSLNGAARVILDARDEEIIGTQFGTLDWGDHTAEVLQWIDGHISNKIPSMLEIREDAPLCFGEMIVTASFIPARGEGDNFGLCILRNITRQHMAETKKQELDNALKLVTKMDAMSSMAGGIAHDFNNLLTVICGNLDMLVHSRDSSGFSESHIILENARNAAYMAVDLTRKISNSSPFGIVSRKKCCLETVVEETADVFMNETDSRCTIELNSTKSLVSIDEKQISVALRNILQNALEADGDGNIRLETGKVTFDSPVIISGQYVPAGEYACVTVSDKGCGIDREQMLKIFDPYYSTKSRGAIKGMGLGLTVVYATMRNHGGYVVVQSALDEGTSVSFYLPHFGYASTLDENKQNRKESKLNILVVENDPQMKDVERIMLEFLGHKVILVDNVVEAMERVRIDSVIKESAVQVVLISPGSEYSTDHNQLCRMFKAIEPELKLVITGGSVLDPILKECRKYGYSNALPKPFTMDSLRHVLNSLM